MASNYPSSLDSFTDPLSNSPLNSPSHAGQHQDLNNSVEQLETKLGTGASPAASASANQVLVANGSGGSSWAAVPEYALQTGLVWIATQSATSGSYIDVLSVFSSSFTNYLVILDNVITNTSVGIQFQLSTGSTPTVNGANWVWGASRGDFGLSGFNYTKESASSNGNQICVATSTYTSSGKCEIYRPNKTTYTHATSHGLDARGTSGYLPIVASGILQDSTAYTGLRINAIGGTFSSITVGVYGYRI